MILDRIKVAFDKKQPFVAYRKPNDVTLKAFFQKDDNLQILNTDFNQSGFVFAPFNSNEKTVFFSTKNSHFLTESFLQEKIKLKTRSFKSDIQQKSTHIAIVKKAIESIKKGEFQKVVISRKEIIKIDKVAVEEIFTKLLQTYQQAFVYVWYHPQIGLWFGATPETLLNVVNNKFITMSLAGTQVYKENTKPIWKHKELEEQQLVTDYIVDKLSSFSINLKKSNTKTVKAGQLLHLRTNISGALDVTKNNSLFSLIDILHPTPAVCGLPKEAAKKFILKEEGYCRSYYTGFLGELNLEVNNNTESNLFVNLRCMKLKDSLAEIYVGGGITAESSPEKEWEETVVKTQTVRKVL